MKKILLAGLVAVAGYLGYKKFRTEKSEQDLWAEATDSVDSATESAPPA